MTCYLVFVLFESDIGEFPTDLIYSCLSGPGGEHRREELYQCDPMVWYHRELRQDGHCQHQSWSPWVNDGMALATYHVA